MTEIILEERIEQMKKIKNIKTLEERILIIEAILTDLIISKESTEKFFSDMENL